MREKLAYRHVLHLSIFVLKENKGSTIGRASERERERSRERERQHSIAADAASASSHQSVCLYLDEKQQ
jgi:L-amino acid N-acyltransferase YncA